MDPHSPPHPRNGFAREWFNIIKDRAPHAVHSDDKSGRSIRTTRPHSRGSSITSVESENNHHLRSTRIPAPRRSAISLRAAFEAAATPTTLPGSPSRKTHLSLNTSPKSHLPVKVRPKQSHESMNTGAMDNNNNNSGRGRHSQNGQSVDMTPRRREPSSSPPRGLREAYARIEYEEELAAAESPPENFGNDQIDWSGRHLIHPRDTLADTLHHPYPVLHPSIMSRPPPVMGSPRTRLQASPEHTLTLGDSTMGSGSGSPSVISGLSSLENGTEDSFVRTMAQHQRDQQRVSGALGGDQPVFSRAHHVNGVKDDKLGDIEVAEREVMEGSSSGPSEGEHILDQGGISKSAAEDHRRATLDLIKKVAHEAAQELTRDVEKGQQQQQQQQARPVSSEGNETSDGGTSSPSSTNKQRRRQRNRLNRREKMRRLREDNRTGKALISRKTSSGVKDDVFDLSRTEIETGAAGEDGTAVVTPITKAKMTVLERIREREMEKLKGQAVATSRLNQLGERSSKEHLRPRQSNIQGEEEGDGERLTIQEHEDNQEVTVEEHPNANATADEIKKDENNNNDDEKKSDPRDLLRQLARATSNSPSPKTAAAVLVQQVETSIPPTRDSTSEPTTSARTHEDVQPKTNEDAATNDDIDDNATPRAEKPQPIPDMTPAVAIGGWINTPTTTFFPSPSETTIRRRREESSSGGGGGIRSLIRGSGPPQHKKTQFHGDNDHDNDDSTMEMLEQFIAEDTLDFATSLKATEGEVKGIKEENLILKEEGDEEVKKSRNRDRDGDGEETKDDRSLELEEGK
ncbi:MAG: hypothetical protein M1823_000843 [Watsoniomyces obsoletus]|nr:MAG: hypothetical protein M1823_000843 [Watsoniomyces obsoletus]